MERADGEVERLAADLSAPPLLARLLLNRGLESAERAGAFLGPRLAEHLRSPMLFRDMGVAAERMLAALDRNETIGIYGDYDVDGISGSAVLLRFLRALGGRPVLHIPHRVRDGYGLSEAGVRRLADMGARLMVTVDCGGVSHRELALAGSLGMDTIVCDHHQVSDTRLPACAVLNPIEADAGFPFRGLCGAGVAFYLALGTRMHLRSRLGNAVPDLRRCLDLVALGTIADLVPVVEENRVLVKYGLRELTGSRHPGVTALKQVSGVSEVSSSAVGFRLAPRLNAGGRLDDATRSVDLLTTADADEAQRLAVYLDDENRARRALEQEILDEAIERVEQAGAAESRRSIVLASTSWHPGVIGIVASRLVERYHRPTILIAINEARGLGRGSGRSIPGLHLHRAIAAGAEHLEGFGGHPMAAGLSVRPEKVDAFAAAFEAAARDAVRDDDLVPVVAVDAELPLSGVDRDSLAVLDRLEPFGMANPEPIFLARGARVQRSRIVGETHLKLQLEQDGRSLPAIAFGMADLPITVGSRLDALYTPMISEWRGEKSVELRLRDLRSHRP